MSIAMDSGSVELSGRRWSPELERALTDASAASLSLYGWDQRDLGALVLFAGKIEGLQVACRVQDLRHISQLAKLKELSLSATGDLTGIDFSALRQLRSLSVCGERGHFGNLALAPALRDLGVVGCALRDLSEFSGLSGLEVLSVSEAPLISLAGIASLRSLRQLALHQVPLVSLDGIELLAELRSLRVHYAPRLRSIAPVGKLPALKELNLLSCKGIKDLQVMGDANQLEYLSVAGIQVPDPSFIGTLEHLKSLYLENAGPIPSLAFLAALRELGSCRLVDKVTVGDGDMSILLRMPALTDVLYTERRHYRPRRDEIMAALKDRRDCQR